MAFGKKLKGNIETRAVSTKRISEENVRPLDLTPIP